MDIVPITTPDGLELHLIYEPPAQPDGLVLLATHGVDANFAMPPYLPLGRRLLKATGLGYAILNNRGHDRINRIRGRLLGSAYETFEDSALDLTAAADWLAERGHRRLVLSGHSLGALKVTYAQVHVPHPNVIALAPLSGPCLVEEHDPTEIDAWLAHARDLLAAGKGQDLMWARPPADRPGSTAPFSAATYLNKYADGANSRILQYVDRVRVPCLFLAGEREPRFAQHARDLHAACQAPSMLRIIPGATHYYPENEPAVAEAFLERLSTLPST
ncbi:MAG: alpha/beta fold hydrolase [Chloroflexi bacterium]|nr:alpha/beta fold hydrolase [Chloroflexota bacterium]